MKFFLKKNIWIGFIILLILLVYWVNHKAMRWEVFWGYETTKPGKVFESSEKIKKDVAFMYYDKYTVESFDIFNMEESQGRELYFYITDSHAVYGDLRIKEITTREAVNILYYLSKRKMDSNIKSLRLVYRPNRGFLTMTGDYLVTISIPEFFEEKKKVEKAGISEDEAAARLTVLFLQKNIDQELGS